MRKFFISILLSIMLVVTLIPQISFADDTVEVATGNTITGFAEIETTDYYYEGNPQEEELTLNLPETLGVYLEGSRNVTEIPVTWEAVEDYDGTDFYFYSMKPIWSSEYILDPELSNIMDVPWITVYKQEPENPDIEPMLTDEEIEPVYTEEEGAIDPEANDSELVSDVTGFLYSAFVDEAYAATTAENTDAIYRYLTETMGLNTAAACGVMTNINAESGMSPINLQNTYNNKLDLSDSEYTDRVDSGKYTKFETDSAGYGLCQWTSSGRKGNLLSFAKSQKQSIGDLNMQMDFFNKELTDSYPSVYTTIKNVPNTPAGAYIAAAEMCMCYEIPANTVNTAASRGKTCLSNYWKKYSGSAGAVKGTSFISLCGYAYPTVIKKGKGMDVTGYAISNYKVTSITGKITNSSGKTVYSKSMNPKTTAAKLSGLDSAMKFSKLSKGDYTYTVSAKDSFGKTVTASHSFTVKTSGSTAKAIGFMPSYGPSSTSETVTNPPEKENTQPKNPETVTSTAKKYSGAFPKMPSRGYFKKGDKGKQVKNLQKFLNWCGCSVSTGGTYGANTVKAVKKLQKKLGLKQDGKFGKKTLKKAKELKR